MLINMFKEAVLWLLEVQNLEAPLIWMCNLLFIICLFKTFV